MRSSGQFTPEAANSIRGLLEEMRRSDRPRQKRLRDEMRNLGFYISDFDRPLSGFRPPDFDELVERGIIRVVPRRGQP